MSTSAERGDAAVHRARLEEVVRIVGRQPRAQLGEAERAVARLRELWEKIDPSDSRRSRKTEKRPALDTAQLPAWPAGGRRDTVWFHAGAHKTASTSLQMLMGQNAYALARQGVAVIPQYIPGHDINGQRPKYYRGEVRKPLMQLTRQRDKLSSADYEAQVGELRSRIGAWTLGAPNLVISDEDLLGPRLASTRTLYPSARAYVDAVVRLFPARRHQVVLYVRDSGAYLESCYVQSLQMRRPQTFETFVGKVELEKLSWERVAARIANAVGKENLIVRRFESIKLGFHGFAKDFFSLFSDASQLELIPIAANPSLSAIGCELALALGPLVGDGQWSVVRRFLQDYFASSKQPKPRFLDGETRSRLSDEYANQLEVLRERFGDFP